MKSSLRDKVVVVTGASSGVGREAAVQFAERGARVVLAARREAALQETADVCRRAAGSVLVIPTDVAVEGEVNALVDQTLAHWGRIDVYVNNAGVTYFTPLSEGPFEEHRRVIETNLYGAMYGARAVIPVFRRQGSGVLINVGSILSKTGQPFVPSYVISKFGLRGMAEALRTELADEPDIHVCTLFPYAIDTPHFETGASDMGKRARAMPPVQSPEKVARAIVSLAERPRRELHVPRVAVLGLALRWLLPETTERLLLHALKAWHFDSAPQPDTQGNLYEPSAEPGRVHGDRGPQLSMPRFIAWAARELVNIEADAARRRLRRLVAPAHA